FQGKPARSQRSRGPSISRTRSWPYRCSSQRQLWSSVVAFTVRCGARADDQLARTFEAVRGLELCELLLDLAPRLLALAFAEGGHHLVQRPERFALEADAVGSRGHPDRRADP